MRPSPHACRVRDATMCPGIQVTGHPDGLPPRRPFSQPPAARCSRSIPCRHPAHRALARMASTLAGLLLTVFDRMMMITTVMPWRRTEHSSGRRSLPFSFCFWYVYYFFCMVFVITFFLHGFYITWFSGRAYHDYDTLVFSIFSITSASISVYSIQLTSTLPSVMSVFSLTVNNIILDLTIL
jgi:hypothetical protein